MKQTMQRIMAVRARAIAPILMLLVLAGGMFLPGADARAADKPKWLGTKIVEWKLVRNEKVKGLHQLGYYNFYVKIRHTNNSSDRVVTALYDKKGTFTIITDTAKATLPLRSTKLNRVSLDPGQSYNLFYTLPITKFEPGTLPSQGNGSLKSNKKRIKWSYDLKVKSEKI